MDLTDKISKYENIHVAFWLVKDTCWMLELRVLGTVVMVPTLFFAFFLVIKTRHSGAFFINAAVFFWILANSYWMVSEFYLNSHHKELAAIPFVCGLLCSLLFVLKGYFPRKQP